ncbi:MAG: hypothetical protein O9256_03700 [Rhizobiaceae bacterium]|nr:hypothetical protein [Rhizobiaceae bacterium]MCZ8352531.1 hypothetical protein [Rhizobium sp.]
MSNLRVHRKQFLISSSGRFLAPEGWSQLDVAGSVKLYHCPELHIAHALNAIGQPVILIGNAIEIAGNGAPELRLSEITHDNWREITDTWGNRWALIIGTSITTDASGMLGVFAPSPQYRRADFAVSSSARLLSTLYPECDEVVRGVAYAPATPMAGIYCLLPGQWLDVVSGEVLQPTRPIFDFIDRSPEQIRDECCALLIEFMRQAHRIEQDTLWISLSGGADSRRNLAAALAAKVNFQPFSFLKKYWQTSDADRKIPLLLGRVVGIETLIIDAGEYLEDSQLVKLYRDHTTFRAELFPGELFYYFTGGHWDAIPRYSAIIDGQNYELVGNYYYRRVPKFSAPEEMLDWAFECPSETRQLSLRYLESASGGSMQDMRDFAFLLANSSVYGQMYQAMDLWCNTYVPANCRRLYSLAQSISPELRQDKTFWISVTNQLQPSFSAVATNPRDGLLKLVVGSVWRQGLLSTVKLVFKKIYRLLRYCER